MSNQGQKSGGGKKGAKGNKKPAEAQYAPVDEGAGSQPTMYAQAFGIVEEKERRKANASSSPVPAEIEQPTRKPTAKAAVASKVPVTKPSAASESAIAARALALDANTLQLKWAETEEKFGKDQHLELLKMVAGFLGDHFTTVKIDEFDDSPLRHVTPEFRRVAVQLMAPCANAAGEMLVMCVERAMSLAQNAQSVPSGLLLSIQFMLLLDSSCRAAHVVANAVIKLLQGSLREKLSSLGPEEAGALFRVLRQVAIYAPHTFILVWRVVGLPILCGNAPEATKTIVADSLRLVCSIATSKDFEARLQGVIAGLKAGSPIAAERGAIMTPKEFSIFLKIVFSPDKCTESQRKVLAVAYGVFRELMLRHAVNVACLGLLLPLATRLREEDPLFRQIVVFIVRVWQLNPDAFKDHLRISADTGIKEASLAVRVLSGALGQGWRFNKPEELKSILTKSVAQIEALGKGVLQKTEVKELIENFKIVQTQLDPPGEDSVWPLWVALFISLFIFVVLVAHLSCKPGMPVALPKDVCSRLEEWGVLGGVERFYELAQPAVPYVEKAVVIAEPYVAAALKAAEPAISYGRHAAGELGVLLWNLVQSAREFAESYSK